jgi:hypothetical protein
MLQHGLKGDRVMERGGRLDLLVGGVLQEAAEGLLLALQQAFLGRLHFLGDAGDPGLGVVEGHEDTGVTCDALGEDRQRHAALQGESGDERYPQGMKGELRGGPTVGVDEGDSLAVIEGLAPRGAALLQFAEQLMPEAQHTAVIRRLLPVARILRRCVAKQKTAAAHAPQGLRVLEPHVLTL